MCQVVNDILYLTWIPFIYPPTENKPCEVENPVNCVTGSNNPTTENDCFDLHCCWKDNLCYMPSKIWGRLEKICRLSEVIPSQIYCSSH